MTTTLSRSRPEDLLRCGAVLGRVAEHVSVASGRARRATALPWHGLAGSAYEVQLSSVASRLNALERSYDEACDVLVGYSRELVIARDLAVRADALDEQADRERVSDVLVGTLVPGLMDNAAAHAQRASQLRAEAIEAEDRAAQRAIDVLEQLVGDAPRSTEGGSAVRMAAGVARGFTNSVVGGIVGLGALAGDAVLGLPFLGSADSRQDHRDDLVNQAKAFVQPWLAVERLLQQWQAHHQSEALGELGGMLLMKKTHAGSKEGARFGYLDEMHESVLRAVYQGSRADAALDEQWLLHRAQARWDADIERLRQVRLTDAKGLAEEGLDLVHHEARGGHLVLRHVGRAREFLRGRQMATPRAPMHAVSSFRDLDEATAAVASVLSASSSKIGDYFHHNTKPLTLEGPSYGQGLVLDSDGKIGVSKFVIVVIANEADGLRVKTAYLSQFSTLRRSS